MQLAAILMAAEGHASNIADSCRNHFETSNKIMDLIQEAQKILDTMPEGEW
jgi:hypothetical protein